MNQAWRWFGQNDEHMGGQADMVAVIRAFLDEKAPCRGVGCLYAEIPFSPGFGQAIPTGLCIDGQPGSPAAGRLKWLAEIRCVIAALLHPIVGARP